MVPFECACKYSLIVTLSYICFLSFFSILFEMGKTVNSLHNKQLSFDDLLLILLSEKQLFSGLYTHDYIADY